MNPSDPTPPVPNASAAPVATREFKTRTASWFPYVFGGCFALVGFVAAVVGIVGLVMGAGSGMALPLLIGVVFVLVGVGIPLGSYFFGKSYAITCRADGFTVRTVNKRKGTEQQEYRWDEVTSTQYDEFQSTGRDSGSRNYVSFIAETARGRAFKVGREIGDFAGLIDLFNARTPHLPYVWRPQAGFTLNVGMFSAGRNAYVRVARTGETLPGVSAPSAGATTMAPPPPPPTSSATPPPPPPHGETPPPPPPFSN
jgi:hypothetical protein